MNQPTPSKILYVDDDSDDCYLLSLSLSESGTAADLVCATNGEEAINYLNAHLSDPPSLIVLDLNMPKWDGRQTLSYIKKQPHLSVIPVVILSTSESKTDQEACVRLGATSYFKKPYHFDGYKQIISSFMLLLGVS
jgi:CheY-like chemotaxis protein